jgi:hypothetical protein
MRARRALETTLNGDTLNIEPAVRRGLLTIADHVDDLANQIDLLRRTVTVVGTGIVLALVTAAITQMFT